MSDLKPLCAYDYGAATVQVSTTVTVTAKNDETHGELRAAIAALLPDFRYEGGLHRVRAGDPKPLGGEYDFDRQARVCFRHHTPTGAIVNTGDDQ